MLSGIGLFLLVVCWWSRGLVRMVFGHDGLVEDVTPPSILIYLVAATLCVVLVTPTPVLHWRRWPAIF